MKKSEVISVCIHPGLNFHIFILKNHTLIPMKKLLIVCCSLILLFTLSCEKKDSKVPVVTLLGANPLALALNSASFDDPGATAMDNEDGDLTGLIKTESNVNLNKKGSYGIRYYVSDNAGNTGEAIRTVLVANQAEFLAGVYTVTDNKIDPQGTPTITNYSEIVSASDTINNRLLVTQFGNHINAKVYINRNGNLLAIPQQEMSCGSPPVYRRFMGTGTILDSTQFVINYTETIGSAVYTGSGTYTKR